MKGHVLFQVEMIKNYFKFVCTSLNSLTKKKLKLVRNHSRVLQLQICSIDDTGERVVQQKDVQLVYITNSKDPLKDFNYIKYMYITLCPHPDIVNS